MKILTLYQATLVCIVISLICIKAQSHKRVAVANSIPKCQQFQRQYDALKEDNKNLTFLIEKMEKTLQEQMQQEGEIEKDLHEFDMKLQALEKFLLQQQSDHLKGFKDTITSLEARKCIRKDAFLKDFQKFSKLQNIISKKFDIQMELGIMSTKSNDLNDDVTQLEPLQQDNENFCRRNFYVKTLEDLSGNIEILQYINQILEEVSENFINESEEHKITIEALPDIIQLFDQKDESGICVRTKDKTTICANQPHPTSCIQYDSSHCSQGKCLIKNFVYGPEPFLVSCDQIHDGGGWIVIQRRINGSLDFFRNWSEYKMGFGDLDGEFWLGLDKLHALTLTLAPVELLIQLKDHDNITKYAKFSEFFIGNEAELYELKEAKDYEGNAGDSFGLHEGQKFTTKDNDNDASYSENCAVGKKGAWWYDDCLWSNLNGKYYETGQVPDDETGQGINWDTFHGYEYSMKFVQMMIRPRNDILSDMELL